MNEKLRNETLRDWKLERFLLEELDAAEMNSIRQAAECDDDLRARLDALRASNEEVLREYPPGWMGRRIRDRFGPASGVASRKVPERRGWPVLRPFAPVALAAVLLIALLVGLPLGPTDEGIRLKGSEEQLFVHRKTETGSEQLQDGDLAAEHDVILLEYRTGEARFGAIVSVDGRGTVTQHLPEQGSQAVQLAPGQSHFLEHSYELDDAPGWEVFFLVTAPNVYSLDLVTGAITQALSVAESNASLDSIACPDEFHVTTFTLVKESSRENQ